VSQSEEIKLSRDPVWVRFYREAATEVGLWPGELEGLPDEELVDRLEHGLNAVARLGVILSDHLGRAVVALAEEITRRAAEAE
jgi:hypothetical protein